MKANGFYALHLDDYALPGFVSGGKYYYGNLFDLDGYFCAIENDEATINSHEETISAYKAFKNGDSQAKHIVAYKPHYLLEPIKIYAADDFNNPKEFKWIHTNIYGFPYYMKAENFFNKRIWVEHNGRFLRCVKPSFTNLSYSANSCENNDYHSLECGFWGQPKVLSKQKSPDGKTIIASRFFMKEKEFASKENMFKDIINFDGVEDYTEFCNDIFGDG